MGQKNQKNKHGKKDHSKSSECICMEDGGFAEHLPDDVWRELMRRRAECPIHGDKQQ